MGAMAAAADMSDDDYAALANFRHALRQFLAFSEQRAADCGLTPQQHQALLAIRGAETPAVTVGYISERLILKPHSASGLVDRLQALDLIVRKPSPRDRRQALLALTPKAEALLSELSASHREEIKRLRPLLTNLLRQLD
jgi:DNA-binding MarR family transcriptional regulator